MRINMRLYLMCTTMLAAAWVGLSAALAEEPPEDAPQTQKAPATRAVAPEVFVLDAGGRMLTGQLATADLAGAIQLISGGKPITISSAGLIWLGIDARMPAEVRPLPWFAEEPLPGRAPARLPPRVRATLRDGQVLFSPLVGDAAADVLCLEHPILGRLTLPFGELKQVQFEQAGGSASARKATASQPAGPLDTVLMSNGDRLEGIVREVSPKQVVLESAGGDRRELPSDSVRLVQLAEVPAPASASAPSVQSQPGRQVDAWLHLRTGETILAHDVQYDAAQAAFAFAYRGRSVVVPPAELVGIGPVRPGRQWLTAIRPTRYEHRPLLSPTMMWQADATCTGLPIRWAGRPVPHGIGVPAGSTLRYDLDGSWRSLIVWPMLDDSAGKAGSCSAAIRVDGKEAWRGSIMPLTTQPAVVVDLSDKHELTLQVEPAQSGDVLTRFVWAWAVLAK